MKDSEHKEGIYKNKLPLNNRNTGVEEGIFHVLNEANNPELDLNEENSNLTNKIYHHPFSNHKGYADIWKSFTPFQQKRIKDNILITTDGKIEIIKMKKRISFLTANHNGMNIIRGAYIDKHGKKGIDGVTYLRDFSAGRLCQQQNKSFFKGLLEIEQFINYFPGKTIKDKIFNFAKIFNLGNFGYFDSYNNLWYNVGESSHIRLSRLDENGVGYKLILSDVTADINGCIYDNFLSPFIVYENC